MKFGQHSPNNSSPNPLREQYRFKFPNGFGASVVRHSFSYGNEAGLWELAVLGLDGNLTYETPITSDVLGSLSDDDVANTLDQIAALTPESIAQANEDRARAERDEKIAALRAELARLEAEQVSA